MLSTHTSSTPKATYSQVAQSVQHPTRNQAIVIDSIEDIPVHEYITTVAKITSSLNIRYVSKISQRRVCFYMDSIETANLLVGKKVNIRTYELEIRPLMSKSQRIIISNVHPIIPNELLLEEIKKLNIRPMSQITNIRAGKNEPGFSHILSFRRQLYINPEDIVKLTPSLKVSYDNTTWWIYLSEKKVSCYICKEEGHVAKFCQNVSQDMSEQTEETENLTNEQNAAAIVNNSLENSSAKKSQETAAISTEAEHFKLPRMDSTLLRNKRPPPVPTSSESSRNSNIINDKENKIVNTSKKPKTLLKVIPTYEEVACELEPAKDHIAQNFEKYPLNFEEIVNFLIAAYDNLNIPEVALTFTSNLTSLTEMLRNIRELIIVPSLKSRIYRIIKKLSYENDSSSENEYK